MGFGILQREFCGDFQYFGTQMQLTYYNDARRAHKKKTKNLHNFASIIVQQKG